MWGTNYWNSANVWVSGGVLGCLLFHYLATYHPSYFPIVFIQPNLLFCCFTKIQELRQYFWNVQEKHYFCCTKNIDFTCAVVCTLYVRCTLYSGISILMIYRPFSEIFILLLTQGNLKNVKTEILKAVKSLKILKMIFWKM